MTARTEQIDSLTPLRGIAALLVVLYHLDSLSFMLKSPPLLRGTSFLSRGYLWVDFFFVLSGFIITHVYGPRFVGAIRKESVREYVVARFSRLYPLHFFALTLSVLLYVGLFSRMPAPAGGDDGGASMAMIYDWKALPFHYLFLLSFGLTAMTWNIPAWSIAAEWWAYLLALPLFRFLNRGVSARTFLVPLVCVVGVWTLVTLHPTHTLNITFDFGLLRCLLDFTVGICLYQLYQEKWFARVLKTDAALLGATLLTVAVLHFPYPAATPPPPGQMMPIAHPLTPYFDALSPLAFAALILCAAFNTTVGHRILNLRPLRWLGDISYSVYLMQSTAFVVYFIGLTILQKKSPTGTVGGAALFMLIGMTLLFDILMAMATYRWIEKPARKWLRRKLLPEQATSIRAA